METDRKDSLFRPRGASPQAYSYKNNKNHNNNNTNNNNNNNSNSNNNNNSNSVKIDRKGGGRRVATAPEPEPKARPCTAIRLVTSIFVCMLRDFMHYVAGLDLYQVIVVVVVVVSSPIFKRGGGYCWLRYCCLESLDLPRIARQRTVCLMSMRG